MIRKATLKDLDEIMPMIVNGRKHIQEYGIPQWINGYPSTETISEDINNDRGYVLIEDNEIVGYFVLLKHDPCYDKIDGKWIDDSPYIAVHRTVTKYFNKGLGSLMFNEIKDKYDHIRVEIEEEDIREYQRG